MTGESEQPPGTVDWERVKDLFQRALPLSLAERRSLLERECAAAPALRAEVESLLDAHDGVPTFLDSPAADAFTDLRDEELEGLVPGQRVGPYELLERVAGGGMGTVWAGRLADAPGGPKVAVKLVRRGLATAQVLRRFAQERRTLANLEHPNIAKLLDGGMTEDGRPYLVMEFITGLPIDDYCERHGLAVAERLRLFRVVCLAVHYAHQNLVVHRDIKPTNILVTADGAPKLLDFGIAKILTPEGVGLPTTLTAGAGVLPMTPEYASPEQVRGGVVTTATDIYSLGVVLYELLAGQRPYELRSRTPAELERVVCTEEPPRPSTAVRQRAAGEEATRLEALGRRLRGDLDNIVLMALRKDPARRYGSAEQLAQDLDRHLRGLPVLARGDSMGYVLGRFVQRHRFGVAAGALLALALVGGAAATAWQARIATREARRAEEEAKTATHVTDFLVDLFQISDPSLARGRTITVREVLDEGAARIGQELREEPKVRAELLNAMGRVYRNLGLHEQAEPLLSESLALFEARYPDGDPSVAQALEDVGILRFAQGRYEEAEGSLRRAYEMRVRLQGADDPDTGMSANFLGMALRELGRLPEAEQLHRRALELRRREPGGSDPHVTNNLASVLYELDRPAEAEALLLEAVALEEERYQGPHPDLATNLNNLGVIQQAQGKLDAAEENFKRALEMRRAVLDPAHPEIGVVLNNLAGVHFLRGDYAGAAERLREALSVYRQRLLEDHPWVLGTRTSLGMALARAGQAEQALAELDGLLPLLRRAEPGSRRLQALTALQDSLLQDSGRPAEAAAPAPR